VDHQQNLLTPHASARHFLGAELRLWRQARHLSVAELARRVFVSRELLQKIEMAQRRASTDLIRACDTVLDTGGALSRLLDFIIHTERAPASTPQPSPAAPPANVRITITAEVVQPTMPTGHPTSKASGDGLATVHPLTGRRVGITLDPPPSSDGMLRRMAVEAQHTHTSATELGPPGNTE
jgi:transcriptional regulator with XRE-family HTH domain